MSKHHTYPIHFSSNGCTIDVEIGATQTLLELLRDKQHQWDVKLGCGKGDCGSLQTPSVHAALQNWCNEGWSPDSDASAYYWGRRSVRVSQCTGEPEQPHACYRPVLCPTCIDRCTGYSHQ